MLAASNRRRRKQYRCGEAYRDAPSSRAGLAENRRQHNEAQRDTRKRDSQEHKLMCLIERRMQSAGDPVRKLTNEDCAGRVDVDQIDIVAVAIIQEMGGGQEIAHVVIKLVGGVIDNRDTEYGQHRQQQGRKAGSCLRAIGWHDLPFAPAIARTNSAGTAQHLRSLGDAR